MKRRAQTGGFTLVEVLAALLIFSTAILGLMSAGTENIRIMRKVEQKQIAGIIADNQLILMQNNGETLKVGRQQESVEMAGRRWQWQIRTEETGQAGFFKLTADVRSEEGGSIIVTRTAFVRRKNEAPQ